MSVSSAFCTVSSQRGVRQTLFEHTPSMQSVGSLQPSPALQGVQTNPPQSMPVSSPSWILFLQDAGGGGLPPSPPVPLPPAPAVAPVPVDPPEPPSRPALPP